MLKGSSGLWNDNGAKGVTGSVGACGVRANLSNGKGPKCTGRFLSENNLTPLCYIENES